VSLVSFKLLSVVILFSCAAYRLLLAQWHAPRRTRRCVRADYKTKHISLESLILLGAP
jgi:hypothetical protein